MAPKQQITSRDLVKGNTSSVVDAVFDRALKAAYKDQQAVLQKAKKLGK